MFLYHKIKEFANQRGISLAKLSEAIGKNKTYISRSLKEAEEGIDQYSRLDRYMPQIAEILGVGISEFYADEGQEKGKAIIGDGAGSSNVKVYKQISNSTVGENNQTGNQPQSNQFTQEELEYIESETIKEMFAILDNYEQKLDESLNKLEKIVANEGESDKKISKQKK